MTTQDLVERLRKPTAALEHPLNPEVFCYVPNPLMSEAADRLSELEAENKRLREVEHFAQAAARWSNPERRQPHTVVSADEMLSAIWVHPSRAALNPHHDKEPQQ